MKKISITEALDAVDKLGDRINKAISLYNPFEVAMGSKLKGERSHKKKEDFEAEVKAMTQSLKDLIRNRELIKDAISASNAITKVEINGEELTIVQVLNRKQTTVESYAALARSLENYLMKAKKSYDYAVRERDEQIERMISARLANAASSGKSVKEDEKVSIREKEEKETPEVVLLDPAKAEQWLKEIQEYVDDYLHKVNFRLSESNSRTFIDVPDYA